MNKKYFTVIPAVYLILKNEDKILFLKRHNASYQNGKYSLPAGHVDGNERFVDAIIRESKEEIGIDLKEQDLSLVHVIHRNYQQNNQEDERLDFFFLADKWTGEVTNCEPHKCSDLSWFSFQNMPSNTIPYVTQVLECVAHKVFYSDEDFDA